MIKKTLKLAAWMFLSSMISLTIYLKVFLPNVEEIKESTRIEAAQKVLDVITFQAFAMEDKCKNITFTINNKGELKEAVFIPKKCKDMCVQ